MEADQVVRRNQQRLEQTPKNGQKRLNMADMMRRKDCASLKVATSPAHQTHALPLKRSLHSCGFPYADMILQ